MLPRFSKLQSGTLCALLISLSACLDANMALKHYSGAKDVFGGDDGNKNDDGNDDSNDDGPSAPQAVVNEAIRAYKEQRARLEAEYAKNRSVFKPDYPSMVQARAQIAELDGRIKTEVNNILSSIQGQYLAAKKAEDQLRAKVASSRAEVLSVQEVRATIARL